MCILKCHFIKISRKPNFLTKNGDFQASIVKMAFFSDFMRGNRHLFGVFLVFQVRFIELQHHYRLLSTFLRDFSEFFGSGNPLFYHFKSAPAYELTRRFFEKKSPI